MKETIQKRLSDSKTARWTALFIVSFTMMWLFSDGCDVSVGKLVDNKGSGGIFYR